MLILVLHGTNTYESDKDVSSQSELRKTNRDSRFLEIACLCACISRAYQTPVIRDTTVIPDYSISLSLIKLQYVNMMLSMLKTTLLHILVIGVRANVVEDLITWVQSEGGSFNEKLEIRRMVPNDISSPYGVYAKENIDAKESLLIIPHECYIQIHNAEDMNVDEGWEEAYHKNLCDLSHKLMKEMKLGEESNYAPYIAYLKTQKPGQLPANWSEPGKYVLKQFFPKGHQVVDWIDQNFKQNNCIGDDPFEEHMVEMTVQRCFDVSLIPIWDMVC